MPDVFTCPWRVGRSLGRTIYAIVYEFESNSDILLGMMDTAELAAQVVSDHNRALDWDRGR